MQPLHTSLVATASPARHCRTAHCDAEGKLLLRLRQFQQLSLAAAVLLSRSLAWDRSSALLHATDRFLHNPPSRARPTSFCSLFSTKQGSIGANSVYHSPLLQLFERTGLYSAKAYRIHILRPAPSDLLHLCLSYLIPSSSYSCAGLSDDQAHSIAAYPPPLQLLQQHSATDSAHV